MPTSDKLELHELKDRTRIIQFWDRMVGSNSKNLDLSEQSTLVEAKRAAGSGIDTSVIYISDGDILGERFARKLAAAGRGVLHQVDSLRDLEVLESQIVQPD